MTDATILRRALRRAERLEAMAANYMAMGSYKEGNRLLNEYATATTIARDARARIEAAKAPIALDTEPTQRGMITQKPG